MSAFNQTLERQPEAATQTLSSSLHPGTYHLSWLFRSIPPERIGLDGEYDHNGLAQRVAFAFSQQFHADHIKAVRVTQRGCVVILAGWVSNQELLDQLVQVALSVQGATDVETYGLQLDS